MGSTTVAVERGITPKQMKYLIDAFKYSAEQVGDLTFNEASSLIERCKEKGRGMTGDELNAAEDRDDKQDYLAIRERAVFEPRVVDSELDKIFSCLNEDEKEQERSAREMLRSSLGMVREGAELSGEALQNYRGLCRHGEWGPFLNSVGIPTRSAQRLIQLAKDRRSLGNTGVQALERAGASFAVRNAHNAHQIAETFQQLRDQKLKEKVDSGESLTLEPTLSPEEHLEIAKEAVTKNQQLTEKSVTRDAFPEVDPAVERADRIRAWQIQIEEALTALRGFIRNDAEFKANIGEIYKRVIAKEMFNA